MSSIQCNNISNYVIACSDETKKNCCFDTNFLIYFSNYYYERSNARKNIQMKSLIRNQFAYFYVHLALK